jgi:integrase
VPSFGPPKTKASNRTVPLSDATMATLAEHVRRFEIPERGLLFVGRDGEPIRRQRIADVWRRACRQAGIEGATSTTYATTAPRCSSVKA